MQSKKQEKEMIFESYKKTLIKEEIAPSGSPAGKPSSDPMQSKGGSMGGALMSGTPVIMTGGGKIRVVCQPGKEKEALETMDEMGIIQLMRPEMGTSPNQK